MVFRSSAFLRATTFSTSVLLAFTVGLLTADLASAQSASGQASSDHIIVYTQKPAAQIAAAATALAQRVQEQGRVRVMVGLRMTMTPPHALPAAQGRQQLQTLQAAQNAVASRVLGRVTGDDIVRFTFIPYMSMYVDAAQVGRLLTDPQVAVVKEDVPRPPLDTDSVPLIHVDKLWQKNKTGKRRTVAILDTGVARNHPVLKGKVKLEACFSSNNGNDGRSLCKDGVVSAEGPGEARNCPTSIPACDHGTHVASIAAATETDDQIGVAPDANIIAIQVFTRLNTNRACKNAPPCISSYDADWIQGLQYVYDHRDSYTVDAVNMSLGGGKYDAACDNQNPDATDAMTTLRSVQIAVIVASGNDGFDGFISYPGCISLAIAIGASSKPPEGEASFSNDSPLVKLLAPGVDIYAAVPPNLFGVKSGTSMAAPHVTGSFAVLSQANPTANVDQILTSLICTAKTIPVLGVGRPRIDLLAAYNHLVAPSNNQLSWSFGTPAEANDWTPLLGTWGVAGGSYRQTTIDTGWIGSSTDDCNSSEQISAAVKRIAPAETTFFSNSGIVFKAKVDYSNSKFVSGYWVAFNKCPTNVSGTCTGSADDPPGQAVFWRLDNAAWGFGSGAGTLLCARQAKQVKVGGFNTIKVFSQNGTHSFYINNKLVCTVDDSTYPTGPVMTAAYLATSGGNDYSVDFVDITSFDGPPQLPLTEATSSQGQPGRKTPNPRVKVMDPASHEKLTPVGMSPFGSQPHH